MNDFCIQMPLQLTFALPDSIISLILLTFPDIEASMRSDSIENKTKESIQTNHFLFQISILYRIE